MITFIKKEILFYVSVCAVLGIDDYTTRIVTINLILKTFS